MYHVAGMKFLRKFKFVLISVIVLSCVTIFVPSVLRNPRVVRFLEEKVLNPATKHGLPIKGRLGENNNSVNIPDSKQDSHGRKIYDTRNAQREFEEYGPLDIMHMKPSKFLENYKNPCWWNVTSPEQLLCLPYFYIVGVKKSGTTDLWGRIMAHPDVVIPLYGKESQWIARGRFGIRNRNMIKTSFITAMNDYNQQEVDYFIHMFDAAAKTIQRKKFIDGQRHIHPLVTGEASPSNLHLNLLWKQLPGNQGLDEPRYTNLDYIKHLTPDAKIIVIFRDPIDRLYSEFFHESTMKPQLIATPEEFHTRASRAIRVYRDCFKISRPRACVYNDTVFRTSHNYEKMELHFELGLYSVYWRDLIRIFRREQLMAIYMPDYIDDQRRTVEEVYSFLDLRKLADKTMDQIIETPDTHISKEIKNRTAGPMLPETRKLLYEFYRPFNDELATLLQDDRFRFLQN